MWQRMKDVEMVSLITTYLSLEESTCETQDLVTFPSTFVGPCFVGVLGMISTERKKERDRRREIRILGDSDREMDHRRV